MAAESPVLTRPDDPTNIGRSPRFNGTTVAFEEFARPLSSPLLIQPGTVIPSATPGQRIYNVCPGSWLVARLDATLDGAASSGNTVVQVLADGSVAATLTIPAGQVAATQAVALTVARGSYLQARVTSAGAGARDLAVQFSGLQVVQDGLYSAAQTLPWALYDAEAGQPKNVGYVQLSGASGDYISTPDSPQLRITGDIEIVARLMAVDWSSGSTQGIVARQLSGTNRSYYLDLSSTGTLALNLSADGTNASAPASDNAVPFADGQTGWVKATWRQSDGRVQYFTAPDEVFEPATWTQLGGNKTLAIASIFAGTSPLEVGSRFGGALNLNGRIYRAIVRSGIGGPTVADFDASKCYGPGYLNEGSLPTDGSGARYVPLSGQSGDYVWTADKPALRITGDLEIVARLAPNWPAATIETLVAKWDQSGNKAYNLSLSATNRLRLYLSVDGITTISYDPTEAVPFAAYATGWVKVTRRQSDGRIQFFAAPDASSEPTAGEWQQLGSDITGVVAPLHAGVARLVLGAQSDGVTLNADGRVYRAIVRNGIGGTKAADFDAEQANTFAQASDGVGNGWFINSPKHHGNWTLSLPKIYDTSGNGHPPAVFGAGSNQPVWMPWTGASNIRSGGGAGNALQYAASNWAPIDALVDLDVWVDVAVHSYTPAAQTPFFERRRGVDPENQFRFALNTNGTLALLWYPLGTTASTITRNSTVNLSTVCGGITGLRIALRAVLDVDNGAGGHTVSFYIRFGGYDGTWMLLESITTAGTTSMPTSGYANRRLEFGGGNATNSGDVSFYAGQLLGSIGGSAVAVMDASQSGQAGYTNQLGGQLTLVRASSGRKLVAQTTAARSARSVIQTASDDWIDVPAVAVPPLDTFQPPSAVAAVLRRWHNPGSVFIFTTKANASAATLGAMIRTGAVAASTDLTALAADGATTDAATGGSFAAALGARAVASMTVGSTSPFISAAANGAAPATDTSRATTVSTSTAGAGRIGATLAGSNPIDMEFEALATYRRDPGANIHAALVAGYNGGA